MEHSSKKKSRCFFGLVIAIVMICIITLFYIFLIQDDKATMRAIVVRVNQNSLDVMEQKDTSLYSVSFAKEGNIVFKQGQEVEIHSDGTVLSTFPAQIHQVQKIKILKEKSDVSIPENVLKYYYSSRNKVNLAILNFTNKGISFTIKDTNKLPYEYSNTYKIYKKNEEAQKVEVDTNRIIPGTENSTSSYLRSKRSNTSLGRSFNNF